MLLSVPTNSSMQWAKPPRLRAGARVALVAPAGPIEPARLDSARAMCAGLGLEPVAGTAVLQRSGYLAGDDSARAADLHRAIEDAAIDAVWALRGGYGTARLLPHVDLACMAARPKP